MAIYHCSVRIFSRAEGHSAVAAAAYRAGELLKDERSGRTHRYDKRHGVKTAFILAPSSAPSKFMSRASLWNAVEASETRKNSRVAREVILALPHELSDTERHNLTRDMALYLIERYRVAVDIALHSPVRGDGHDPRNHHAHLLFTTRELTNEGLGAKTRILDDKVTGPQEIEIIREVWETLANDALSRAGFTDVKIDRRTLEGQGIDRIPQTHIGNTAVYEDTQDERTESDDDEEDETSGESDTGTQGKSGDTGTVEPKLKDKEKEALKQKAELKEVREAKTKEETEKVERTTSPIKTRADIVEEIKRLNAQRAAFSDIPLKDQIELVDKLLERLDGRLEKLKTLSDKTSLQERMKSAILSLFVKAKEAFIVREEGRTERALTQAEKETRAERHQARYGRNYRSNIYEQIRDMRENIQTLKSKEAEYKKYNGFVSLIERRIESIRREKGFIPPLPIKPEWVQKVTTPQAVESKIRVEAKLLRDRLRPEYRPKDTASKIETSFKATQEIKTLKQTDIKPAKSTLPIKQDVRSVPEPRSSAPVIQTVKELAQNISSRLDKPLVTKPSGQTNPIEIRSHAEHKPQLEPKPTTPNLKDWKIPASEKMRPLAERLAKEAEAIKAAKAVAANIPRDLKSVFNNPRPEEKITTTASVLEKVRTEAEIKRQAVPEEFRAAPYAETKPVIEPEATKPIQETVSEFRQAWNRANPEPIIEASQPSEPLPESEIIPDENPEPLTAPIEEQPRVRMSSIFNKASLEQEQDIGDIPSPPANIDPSIEPK